MLTGTIKSIAKIQAMELEWQEKKNNLSFKKKHGEMTQQERILENLKEQAREVRESNEHADLYNKLKSGGKLTDDEIRYLEQNDPQALAKYREAQAEKEAYKKALKNCKTKEDVERVKLGKVSSFAAQAKSIVNNPYIPKSQKLALMNDLNNRVCLIEEAHLEFQQSPEYQNLPTDEEYKEETGTGEYESEIKLDFEDNESEATHIFEDDESEATHIFEGHEGEIKHILKNHESEIKLAFKDLKDEIQSFTVGVETMDHKINIAL